MFGALAAERANTGWGGSPEDEDGRGSALAAARRTIYDALITSIDLDHLARMSARRARDELRDLVGEVVDSHGLPLSFEEQDEIAHQLGDDLVGLGPLDALLARADVTEVHVSAPDDIVVAVNGVRRRAQTRFRDDDHVLRVGQRLAREAGVNVDQSTPTCEALAPNGAVVVVTVPPVSARPLITIRRPPAAPSPLAGFIAARSMSETAARTLGAAVRNGRNILLAGPTGLDRARLLGALVDEADAGDTLAVVDGAGALTLRHPGAVRFQPILAADGRAAALQAAFAHGADVAVIDQITPDSVVTIAHAMAGGRRILTALDARAPADAAVRFEALLAAAMGGAGAAARALTASALDVTACVSGKGPKFHLDGLYVATGVGKGGVVAWRDTELAKPLDAG